MGFWSRLESIDKQSRSYDNLVNYKTPEFMWAVPVRIVTLASWVLATAAASAVLANNNLLGDGFMLLLMMYGAIFLGMIASIFQVLFPLMSESQSWLMARYSYKISFIVTGSFSIFVTILFFYYIFLPIENLMQMLIFNWQG